MALNRSQILRRFDVAVGSSLTFTRCRRQVRYYSDRYRIAVLQNRREWWANSIRTRARRKRSVRPCAQRSDENVASELVGSHTASTTIG